MELNITRFFNEATPWDYSGSVAERGPDAGQQTWQNAVEAQGEYNLIDTPEKRAALIDHLRGFGSWGDEEMAAWTDAEANALFIQLVSGDMREAGLDGAEPDWEEYGADAAAGRCPGNIFRADDGTIYYDLQPS